MEITSEVDESTTPVTDGPVDTEHTAPQTSPANPDATSDGTHATLPISKLPVPGADILGKQLTDAVVDATTVVEGAIPGAVIPKEAETAIKALIEVAEAVIGKGGNLALTLGPALSTYKVGTAATTIGVYEIPLQYHSNSGIVDAKGPRGKKLEKLVVPLQIEFTVVRIGPAPKPGTEDTRPLGIKGCRIAKGDGHSRNMWSQGLKLGFAAEVLEAESGRPYIRFTWTFQTDGRGLFTMQGEKHGFMNLTLDPQGLPTLLFPSGDTSKNFRQDPPKHR
ncbi:hypothetical protein [Kitasatospora mediocidica]|uniref:hypothetical protein n=1 Tax=Kitasatospora mediocidica TaxID=58352 RepID=UPI0005635639|nr:hypothetical protein [Kitasatospora mediocidica]